MRFCYPAVSDYGADKSKVMTKIYGKSTDTKPITCPNGLDVASGSVFVECDTGLAFVYEETGQEWTEIPGGGGGGSTAAIPNALIDTLF